MFYEYQYRNDALQRVISLEAQHLVSSNEAIANYFPMMITKLASSFGKIKEVAAFSSAESKVFGLSKDEQTVIEGLQRIPYDDLINLRLPCPEGFSGNMLAYSDELEVALGYYSVTSTQALERFYILLADVITNKDAKKSIKELTQGYQALKTARQEVNDSINAFFIRGSNVSEVVYSKAFTSNDEVKELFKRRQALTTLLKKVDLEVVKDQTSRISDSLKTLIEYVKRDDATPISSVQMKNIADGAYEMAAQVEFTTINYYRVVTFLNVVALIRKRLERRVNVR